MLILDMSQFLTHVPENRTHLLPHYVRLVVTLNPYMPEIGTKLVSALDEDEGAVPYSSFNLESRTLFIFFT
jgi:hypothetical protein